MSSNLVVIADIKNNFSGNRFATFSLTNGDILDSFTTTDDNALGGASCTLTNGGVLFLNGVQNGNSQIFYLSYRRPDNTWWTNMFDLPIDPFKVGSSPTDFYAMNELNGEVYVFHCRDSWGTLTLTRLALSAGAYATNYHNYNFISEEDSDRPDQEVPEITSVLDIVHDRILVMYACEQDRYMACGLTIALGHSKILSVKSDLSKELLVTTPYWQDQHKFVAVFAHADGPAYMQGNFSQDTCSGPFIAVPITGATRSYGPVSDSYIVSSPDDWVAFKTISTFEIQKLFSATSKVTIRFFNKP